MRRSTRPFGRSRYASPSSNRRLNAAFNRVLEHPETRARLSAAGLDVAGGSPEAFATLIRAEVQRWAPVLRQLSLRLD